MAAAAHLQSTVIRTSAALLATVMLAWTSVGVDGQEPRVQFDVDYTSQCHDVTSESFAAVYPDEKIIEVSLRTSVWIVEGAEADLEQLTFAISSSDRRMRVVDFSPITLLESDISGEISVVRSSEKIHSLGATLGGSLTAPHGLISAQATPSGNATRTERDELKESSRRIPAKTPVLISGTINGGYGVFYKLKPSVHDSLEGTKQFTCLFAVPRDWRGDWITVTCRASGHQRQYVFDKLVETGAAEFTVGLYLAGDLQSKLAALVLAEAQGAWLSNAADPSRPDGSTGRVTRLMDRARSQIASSSAWLVSDKVRDLARDAGWIDDSTSDDLHAPSNPAARLDQARMTMSHFANVPPREEVTVGLPER